jgi:uncharacterized protein (TIGR02145 family)
LTDLVVTVNQAGVTPTLAVIPSNRNIPASDGATTFEVTSNVSWTVEETVEWFSVNPVNGNNNGALTVTYDVNSSPESRIGEITLTANGGAPVLNVTVTQDGFVWSCGFPITDSRDTKTYNTVQIGNQCWIKENLAYLPNVSPSSIGSLTSPYYYVYGYEGSNVVEAKATSNYQAYGALYNWPAAHQTICPQGWHVASDAEWTVLTTSLGGESVAGGKMKEEGFAHWNSPNTGATNSSGFTSLPGGYRGGGGGYIYLNSRARWWTFTAYSTNYAWEREILYDSESVGRHTNGDNYANSVRCIKD